MTCSHSHNPNLVGTIYVPTQFVHDSIFNLGLDGAAGLLVHYLLSLGYIGMLVLPTQFQFQFLPSLGSGFPPKDLCTLFHQISIPP